MVAQCRAESPPMKTRMLQHTTPPAGSSGFTLVEVTMAIGIVAFAFVSLMGLLSAGQVVSRSSVSNATCAHILSQISSEIQQLDSTALFQSANPVLLERSYDDQAMQVDSSDKEKVYDVRVVTSQTDGVAQPLEGKKLAVVTVQIVNNPANREIPIERGLWKPTAGADVTTYPTFVAKR